MITRWLRIIRDLDVFAHANMLQCKFWWVPVK